MIFEIIDRLEEEFPSYTFGTNKEGEMFVNGQKVKMVWSDDNLLKHDGQKNAEDALYDTLKSSMLKAKYIKKEKVIK